MTNFKEEINKAAEIVRNFLNEGYPIEHPDITCAVMDFLDCWDWEDSAVTETLTAIYEKAQ